MHKLTFKSLAVRLSVLCCISATTCNRLNAGVNLIDFQYGNGVGQFVGVPVGLLPLGPIGMPGWVQRSDAYQETDAVYGDGYGVGITADGAQFVGLGIALDTVPGLSYTISVGFAATVSNPDGGQSPSVDLLVLVGGNMVGLHSLLNPGYGTGPRSDVSFLFTATEASSFVEVGMTATPAFPDIFLYDVSVSSVSEVPEVSTSASLAFIAGAMGFTFWRRNTLR